MNPQVQQARFVRVGIAAIVILAASFMPWFTIRQAVPFGGIQIGNFNMTVTMPAVSAWKSNITILAITLPNWILVAVAAGMAFTAWRSADGNWIPPKSLTWGLPIYGVCHTAYIMLLLISNGGRIGAGLLLTCAAFVWMLFTEIRKPALQSVMPLQ
ncbi:MAG: hypothetical protein ACKVT0_21610 [Planctomycetaceae bacterium]